MPVKAPRIGSSILCAVLASALLWQASAHAATSGLFGVRATFEPDHFVVEMRMPILCLRLQGAIPGFIVATAHLLTCAGCGAAPRTRSWS